MDMTDQILGVLDEIDNPKPDTSEVAFVCVRSWYDRVNGVSYFSIRVHDQTKWILPEYAKFHGLGWETYAEEALRMLNRKRGLNLYENLVIDCVDVSRKKDLHKF